MKVSFVPGSGTLNRYSFGESARMYFGTTEDGHRRRIYSSKPQRSVVRGGTHSDKQYCAWSARTLFATINLRWTISFVALPLKVSTSHM